MGNTSMKRKKIVMKGEKGNPALVSYGCHKINKVPDPTLIMPFLAVVSLLTPSGNALVSVTPSTSYFKPLIDTFSLESLRENTDTMPVASFGTVKLLSLMNHRIKYRQHLRLRDR